MFGCFRLKKSAIFSAVIVGILIAIILSVRASKSVLVSLKANDGIFVPIIMYHSVVKDETKTGDYVITPVTLEEDLIYLAENGYTTIFVSDLISYVYDGVPLPDKPVIITFDDGSYNNYLYVLPLLKRYDMKAVFSIVGQYTQGYSESGDKNPAYAYMSWDDICELNKSGNAEIINHSYNMHSLTGRRGALRLQEESLADYKNVFIADTIKVNNALLENCKIKTQVYAFPYGFSSGEAVDILKSIGFKALLNCNEKPNYITSDPECLFDLNRYNRPYGISTEKFMNKALKN